MKEYFENVLGAILSEMEGVPEHFTVESETPARPEHGDISTNVAMRLAEVLGRRPRKIAEEIVDRLRRLPVDPEKISSLEVAGAGFINARFAESYLYESLQKLLESGADFGRSESRDETAIVEYVSANPTGPLTVGHGRNAVLGDTIANLLEWMGYEVTREYYFNDAGRQMRVLGESVRAHYLALVDPELPAKTLMIDDGLTVEVPEPFPDDGYLGEYVADIAETVRQKLGDGLAKTGGLEPYQEVAEMALFSEIEATLRRMKIDMDVFFNEHTLFEHGRVGKIVDRLRDDGHVYDQNGATWFMTSAFGKTDSTGNPADTVLVKSSGEPTYRLPDIAYHETKFERGFDRIVDVFGADHVAAYPDVVKALELLGYDTDRIDVVIYQFVTLMRGDKPVKMSTRRASYVTLDELMDEVGEDVTRYFFLMRSPNTHLEFDLDLAKEASEKNPVFYLQYAHARICSILRKADEEGISIQREARFALLTHEAEKALIKELLRFPEALARAAESMEPHQVANYLREVAVAFTQFYGHCRIIGEEADLATARLRLARAAQHVLANGMRVLGVSAPERM